MATKTYTSDGWVALCDPAKEKVISKMQVKGGDKYFAVGVEVVFAKSEKDLDAICTTLGYLLE